MSIETTRNPFERNPDAEPREVWSHKNGGTGLTRCGGCTVVWWQSGNQTSHCGACHATFSSLAGFDSHHEIVAGRLVCHDPAVIVDDAGRFRFASRAGTHFGEAGAVYWSTVSTGERLGAGLTCDAAPEVTSAATVPRQAPS